MVRSARDPGFSPADDELPDVEPRKRPGQARRVGVTLFAPPGKPLQKQIQTHVPIDDWRRLDREAARRGVTLKKLLQDALEPFLAELRNAETQPKAA